MRMDTLRAELTQFESAKDLKTLLGVEGPCVTIYMPLAEGTANQAAKANALEWRELLRQMESKAQDYKSKGGSLLEPLKDWDAFFPEGPRQGQSIGIFRSANVFRLAWLSERVPSRAMVGPQFFIRPLLLELKRNKTFYLLALSQKNVRLLRCTMHSSEEVPLPQSVAVNFDEYMNT